MTTIVNNPVPVQSQEKESGSGIMGIIIGAIILIGLAMVIFYVGIPAIRRMGPAQINLPATQVVIPSKIDVNVTEAK